MKLIVFKLLAVGLALALGAVLIELFLRIDPPPWLAQRILQVEATGAVGSGDQGWPVVRYNGVFKSFVPGSTLTMIHGEYDTRAHVDELGGRAVPTVGAAADAPRLPFMGDSFTFGVGVADDETYVSRLAVGQDRLRYVNLGVTGTALPQQLRIVELRHAELGRPGVYVFDFTLSNDFSDIVDNCAAPAPGAAPAVGGSGAARVWLRRAANRINDSVFHGWLARHSYFLQFIKQAVVQRFDFGGRTDRTAFLAMDPARGYFRERAHSCLEADLDHLQRLATDLHFRPLFLVLPNKYQLDAQARDNAARYYGFDSARIDRWLPNRAIAAALDARALPYLDATQCLQARYDAAPEPLYFLADDHHTPAGNRALAGCLVTGGFYEKLTELEAERRVGQGSNAFGRQRQVWSPTMHFLTYATNVREDD